MKRILLMLAAIGCGPEGGSATVAPLAPSSDAVPQQAPATTQQVHWSIADAILALPHQIEASTGVACSTPPAAQVILVADVDPMPDTVPLHAQFGHGPATSPNLRERWAWQNVGDGTHEGPVWTVDAPCMFFDSPGDYVYGFRFAVGPSADWTVVGRTGPMSCDPECDVEALGTVRVVP